MKNDKKPRSYPLITDKDLPYINDALQRGNKVHIEGKDEKTVIVTEYRFNSKRRIETGK